MPRAPSAASPPLDNGRRSQIIAAAAKAFARKGYHATTVKDVATEAGVAPGTLYLYFAGKRELLTGFFDEVIGVAEARMADLANLPLERALATFLRERLEMLRANRDVVKVILTEALYDDELRGRVEGYVVHRVRGLIVQFLREHGAGRLPPTELRTIAQALQAQVLFCGVIGPALQPNYKGTPATDARRITRFALQGLNGLMKEAS